MPYFEFQWNETNLAKLELNDVLPEDFEDVVCHPRKKQKSRTSGLPIAFGYASDGRLIACVYDMIDELIVLPITGYYIEPK